MTLLVGALAVLLVLVVAENLPVRVTQAGELTLTVVASIAATALLFNYFDKEVVAWTVAIAGLGTIFRAGYRLVRAWADGAESGNVLQAMRGRR